MGTLGRLAKLLLEYARLLDGLRPEELGDVYKFNAAVHLLQVQVQSLIDMAVRAASLLGLAVEGYIDAGVKLREAGLLNDDELSRYKAAVRFRNIAVHQYGVVDPKIVARIVGDREYRRLVEIGLKIYEELRERGLDP